MGEDKKVFWRKTATIALLIFLAAAVVVFVWQKINQKTVSQSPTVSSPDLVSSSPENNTSSSLVASATPSPSANISGALVAPIDQWQARVTKKPFGIYVSPGHSPVSPERFTGYHTGVDFETFPDEQDTDVAISAVCDGPLLLKESASGYGGVAVQGCKLDGQDITVIYGHLKFSSVQANVGQQLAAGEQFAILGKGYSVETDGERKHLHLGIHKGNAISILGYVQNASELSNWLDITKYLK